MINPATKGRCFECKRTIEPTETVWPKLRFKDHAVEGIEDDPICEDCRNRSLLQSHICYACKAQHALDDLWVAVPHFLLRFSDNGELPGYEIFSFTECGRQAHTEAVATVHAYLHNAKRNAQDIIDGHNLRLLKEARENKDRLPWLKETAGIALPVWEPQPHTIGWLTTQESHAS